MSGQKGTHASDFLDRPVAFHPILAQIMGGAAGGIFLSQAVYWQKICEEKKGREWWWKTASEWRQETFLSRREQENARAKLRKMGVLHEKKKGVPSKIWFRLDLDRLNDLLTQFVTCDKLVCTDRTNKNGGSVQTKSEITPENTSSDDYDSIREDESPAHTRANKKIEVVLERVANAIKNGKGPAAGKEAPYLGRALRRQVSECEADDLMARAREIAGVVAGKAEAASAQANKARDARYAASLAAGERKIAAFRAGKIEAGVIPPLDAEEVAS